MKLETKEKFIDVCHELSMVVVGIALAYVLLSIVTYPLWVA